MGYVRCHMMRCRWPEGGEGTLCDKANDNGWTAHLYLYPHGPNHGKASTVPGAFPTTDEPKDFARKLKLSAEKPVQPIGRSSRNEAKGLFAGPDNGYFD